MKYAVEMGSVAMICMPSFRKMGSGIQKLMGGGIHKNRKITQVSFRKVG
jgi:hypothetical protein